MTWKSAIRIVVTAQIESGSYHEDRNSFEDASMINSIPMVNTRRWVGLVLWQFSAVIGVQYAVYTTSNLLGLLPANDMSTTVNKSMLLMMVLWLGVHHCTFGSILTRNAGVMLRLPPAVAKVVWYITLILPAGLLGLVTIVLSQSASRSLSLADVMLTWLLSGSWACVHCLTIGPVIERMTEP